jgi:zinc protease
MSFLQVNGHTIPKLTLPLERFELACGATLCVSPRPGAPVCAIYAHVRGGPALDPKSLEGTAYLVGALCDQGTREHDEEEIATLLEPAGGEISGDASGLSGTIVTEDWELLVDLMCEQLVGATYPKEACARQKKRLLDRLLVERDDPRNQGGLLFRRFVYGDHWLGRAAYGTLESVRRIDVKHLRAFHRENWVGKRLVIAVCGDVDPRAVLKRLERGLAKLAPGTPLDPQPPTFPPRARRIGLFPAERQQVHLYLGHLGVQRGHPDYAALVVMDHVLGTGPGFTNRISRRLRDELGLAYSVHASIHASAGILPGMFTAYIGTSPQHVGTAIGGFLEEIRRIQAEPVTPEELEIAKSYLLGSYPLGFERVARRVSYIISSVLHGFGPENLEQLLAQFAAVTTADVQRVAREHLHPDASCLAASGPLKQRELERAFSGTMPATTPGAVTVRKRTAKTK